MARPLAAPVDTYRGAVRSGVHAPQFIEKSHEFEVEVITYKSTSASTTYFQDYGSGGPFKKETLGGRSAYVVVGNAASTFLNGGTPIKNATGGLDWVLDGKSIVEAWSITTAASMTTSFLNSLKLLS